MKSDLFKLTLQSEFLKNDNISKGKQFENRNQIAPQKDGT